MVLFRLSSYRRMQTDQQESKIEAKSTVVVTNKEVDTTAFGFNQWHTLENVEDDQLKLEKCTIKKFRIAGSFACNTNTLIKSKQLKRGSIIELTSEPMNVYDSNAIAIYFEGEKIGYVPKSINTKIVEEQITSGRWKIYSIKKLTTNKRLNFEIHCFDVVASFKRPKAPSTASTPQNVIYRISINGHQYHGSTTNFNKRKLQHLRELKQGNHHNKELQREYDRDPSSITFRIIEKATSITSMKETESEYIKRANRKGKSNQITDTRYNPNSK